MSIKPDVCNRNRPRPIAWLMAKPRSVLPGQYYMIQRRCSERRFFLRPDDTTNATFWYCLGVALERTGVQLIATIAMSNHVHVVVYDSKGTLPDFLHRFHQLLARAQNCHLRRWESFWSAEQTSRVRLVTIDDVIRKVAYVLANPVTAHLVDTAAHWPGATSWAAMKYRRVIAVTRPRQFFRKKMPPQIQIAHHVPSGIEHDAFWQGVETAVSELEAQAAETRRVEQRKILGRRQVRKQSPFARPSTEAARRGHAPRVASISKWHRFEALHRDKEFHAAYAEARRVWQAGGSPTFPAGTWGVRKLVKVESAPTNALALLFVN